MIKDKEKVIDVTLTKNGKEENIKVLIRKPNNALISQAQRVAAKSWTDCVRDGIMTKKELEKFMKEQDIWNSSKETEQKHLSEEINNLERKLFLGSGKKISKSEGKRIAIEMRIKRNQLRDLISERMSLEQNTAESLSDNARFDFLVANSTYYENGQKVYSSLDDYTENADGEIAFAAASALAQMLYSVDKDFESKLPENKFLKMFNFVNDDLSLVNSDGETVDTEGRKIDKSGFFVNDDGNRVDKDGNLLDENGNYVISAEYVDDEDLSDEESPAVENKPVKKVTKARSKKKTTDS